VAHGSSIYELDFDGANTIIDQWITYAGGINAAAEGLEGNLQTISMEQVLVWDPDVLITGRPQSQVDEIMADPAWSTLKAVKSGRVYSNPRGVFAWDRYGVEAALQPQWCAKVLYPELFEDFDMAAELKAFYLRFFGYALSDAQAEMIMNYVTPELDPETRTIVDLMGNEVQVPIPVKKISTGKLNLTQLTLILAGSESVANLGDGADASKGTLLNAMFPELEGMTVLTESNMDAEALLIADPDLVMLYNRSTELGGNLQTAGFNVAYCNLGNEEELLQTMKIMATALGGSAPMQAQRYETFYRELMADVAEKSAAIAEDSKPMVAYIRGNGAVCGLNSMPNNWITAAGGVNIGALAGFPQYAAEMSAEDLIMYDPEIIFAESAQTLDYLGSDAFAQLSAVKNGKVYIVPYGLSCSGLANAENPLVWQWAANLIQPSVYNYDAEQTIRDFFKDFYGYELSDAQLDTILHKD
jgi:ABC-type Fe3+-hydroxamate transport system substrate-binding protein